MPDNTFDPRVYNSIYRERWIDPTANPRVVDTDRAAKIVLYHYTRPSYRDPILKNGLNRGDVPVRMTANPSDECFNNAVWLTSDPDPEHQGWDGGLRDKRQIRMSVELDAGDQNLWLWSDLARHLNVETKWYRILNGTGGGYAAAWYVYVNIPIAPSRIIEVVTTKRVPKKLNQVALEALLNYPDTLRSWRIGATP